MTGARPAAGTNHRGEIIRCVQSTTSRKHWGLVVRRQSRRDRQANSSTRPLRRRAARMARPARVCIRSRKPWVFARRRLFGWKVRLLTGISPLSGTAGMTTETHCSTTTSTTDTTSHGRAEGQHETAGIRRMNSRVRTAGRRGQTRRAPRESHSGGDTPTGILAPVPVLWEEQESC